MRSAMADGVIVVDSTTRIKLPAAGGDLVVLEPAVVRTLVGAAAPPFREAIVLGAHVGLRAGEAQGLLVSDVDFLRRTVNVRPQLDGHRRWSL